MGNLDLLADHINLLVEKVKTRSKDIVDIWSLLRVNDSQLFQRSKAKWLKDGDTNLGFFCVSIKCRSMWNSIQAFKKIYYWIE